MFKHVSKLILLPVVVACGGQGDALEESPAATVSSALTDIAPHRSLAITEVDITSRFTLEALLARLIEQAGAGDQTPLDLFRQWAGTNAVCDDINGFPLSCRPSDVTADQDPFPPSSFAYEAVGLFNRFDLASADGSDCGEYRTVFERRHQDFGQEKTLIFEARLPNPSPGLGLEGCRPVAEFWANLSTVSSNAERGDQLLAFYFDGLPGFAPAIHVDHFRREPGSGQVRTNSFLNVREWSLREFGIRNVCTAGCRLEFVQAATAENPFLELSTEAAGDPRKEAFQNWLVDFVSTPGEGLLADSIGAISLPVPAEFDAGESLLPESRGFPLPVPNLSDNLSPALSSRLQAKLDALGTGLTAKQVMDRANTRTCNGCHRSSIGDDLGYDGAFPAVERFRHVQLSLDPAGGPDGPRHSMSEALKTVFLPFRRDNLIAFLQSGSALEATVGIASNWQTGYCANVSVTNTGSETAAWKVVLDLSQATLTNSWNGSFAPAGSHWSVTAPSWGGPLPPGQAASFGYCAAKTGPSWEPRVVSTGAP